MLEVFELTPELKERNDKFNAAQRSAKALLQQAVRSCNELLMQAELDKQAFWRDVAAEMGTDLGEVDRAGDHLHLDEFDTKFIVKREKKEPVGPPATLNRRG